MLCLPLVNVSFATGVLATPNYLEEGLSLGRKVSYSFGLRSGNLDVSQLLKCNMSQIELLASALLRWLFLPPHSSQCQQPLPSCSSHKPGCHLAPFLLSRSLSNLSISSFCCTPTMSVTSGLFQHAQAVLGWSPQHCLLSGWH